MCVCVLVGGGGGLEYIKMPIFLKQIGADGEKYP